MKQACKLATILATVTLAVPLPANAETQCFVPDVVNADVCITVGAPLREEHVVAVEPDSVPSAEVHAYLDTYKFTVGATEHHIPCVVAAVNAESVNPCASLGFEFESRLPLLDVVVQKPVPSATPTVTVRLCNATLTYRVVTFGSTIPFVTTC